MRDRIRTLRMTAVWLCLAPLLLLGAGGFAHDLFVHHDHPDTHCDVCIVAKHSVAAPAAAPAGPALVACETVLLSAAAPVARSTHADFAPRGPPVLLS